MGGRHRVGDARLDEGEMAKGAKELAHELGRCHDRRAELHGQAIKVDHLATERG